MTQEKPSERKKILAEIFEELSPEVSKEQMLERANAILTEAGRRDDYKDSISIPYASEAYSILNHPKYDEKENQTLNMEVEGVFNNVARGNTLRQYCMYLLERARENYTNEGAGHHPKIAEKVLEFLDQG